MTFDYTPELNRFLFRHGINRDVSLNMFDYWQSALAGAVRDYPFVNEFNGLKTKFEYYGQRTTPDYVLSQNKLSLVRYFNSEDQLVIEDHWDIRGFFHCGWSSMAQILKKGAGIIRPEKLCCTKLVAY